ncbi:MAG: sigma-E processing peptidase SpoIIGA [Bacilli bacterium]|nr:sigma-E processing peptidase SpoIIGA [Bacilli bacterium]
MKIYIDLVLLLNFGFDLVLLFGVAILLRRQTTLRRLLLGALVGSITILSMFIELSSLSLFLIKILISIIMVLIVFGYHDIRYLGKNLFYLYTSSILLGGFLYLLNLEFSYQHEGLIFYFEGLSINVIVLIVLSPIIIYAYVKQGLLLKNHYSNYYNVDIYLSDGQIIPTTAFMDTGNKLEDPYKRRPIILLNKELVKLDYNKHKMVLVPYDAINHHGLLKCIIPEKIFIQGIGFKDNFLIGISDEKILIDGVDCIMHSKLIEREVL